MPPIAALCSIQAFALRIEYGVPRIHGVLSLFLGN